MKNRQLSYTGSTTIITHPQNMKRGHGGGSHGESENFIRRNLKKRFKGYRKPIRKGDGGRGGKEKYYHQSESDSDENDAPSGKMMTTTAQADASHGISSLGLDPLQLSLNALNYFEGQHQTHANLNISNPSASTFFDVDAQSDSKGQSFQVEKNKKSSIENYRNSNTSDMGIVLSRGKRTDNTELLDRLAPKCPGHGMPAKLLTVKKAGGNKGRRFYGCTYPEEQRCKMFMWVEDNPDLLAHSVATACDERKRDDEHPTLGQLSAANRFAFEQYREKLELLVTEELKNEIRRVNRRIELLTENRNRRMDGKRSINTLKVSGRRDELMERLLVEAVRCLRPQDPICIPSVAHDEEGHSDDYISLSDESDDSDDSKDDMTIEKAQKTAASGTKKGPSGVAVLPSSSSSFSSSASVPLSADEVMRTYFGFSGFLSGQQWAVDRCLSLQRSLLIMPTGAGKSLCYMVPAGCLPGITIVVSPLISLMQDQVKKLPVQIPFACLSGALDSASLGQLTAAVVKGFVKVVYVSPERLCTEPFRALISKLRRGGGLVSLLCIDEAHCLSSWSFNFRPAFLRIKRELRFLQPRAVLALTATASPSVQQDICEHLGMNTQSDVQRMPSRRDNLRYAACVVESEEDKRENILQLLAKMKATTDKDPKSHQATIVYVWRRDEATSLCEFLQGSGVSAVAYHAGMSPEQRMVAQESFFRGNANVIVATVAFGMGVDKSDVRNVIHSSMPKSLESYIQETGRAGRDGLPASCHLVLSKEDLMMQSCLASSNRLGYLQVYALLTHVFVNASSTEQEHRGVIVSQLDTSSKIRILRAVKQQELQEQQQEDTIYVTRQVHLPVSVLGNMDLPEPVAETILSILELPPFSLVEVETRFRNVVTGRLRFKPVYASAAHRPEGLLDLSGAAFRRMSPNCKQLLQCISSLAAAAAAGGIVEKEIYKKKTIPKVVKSWYESRGVLSDGDDCSEEEETHASSSAYAASYDPCKFVLLLSDIVLLLRRPKDEVTLELYILQKGGFIEYTLSEPCICFSIIEPQVAIKISSISGFRGDSVLSTFVHELTSRVVAAIDVIEEGGALRLLDMWRVGTFIAHQTHKETKSQTSSGSRKMDGAEEGQLVAEVAQPMIRHMLAAYMEHDVATEFLFKSPAALSSNDDSELIYSLKDIPVPLISCKLQGDQHPVFNLDCFSHVLFCEQTDLQRATELDAIRTDILTLSKDIRISLLVKKIASQKAYGLTTDKHLLMQLKAVYFAKVFHGLGTGLLVAAEWREHSGAWKRYTHYVFGFLVNMSYATLLSRDEVVMKTSINSNSKHTSLSIC